MKKAFTLAEVLITLAIIGVVAAITLPVFVSKYNKFITETRLKKFYSEINQAITMAEADLGDKIYWEPADTEEFWTVYLEPYLRYLRTEDTSSSSGTRGYKNIYFPNGSAVTVDIYFSESASGEINYTTYGGHFSFYPEAKYLGSTKCIRGKNQFYFAFWPNEEKTGFEYHKNKGVEPYLVWWDGEESSLYSHKSYGCNETSTNRFYCTEIIKRNGWKIPDEYPFKF